MLLNDYKIQNGCVNCKNVFEIQHHDSDDTYHCTKTISIDSFCHKRINGVELRTYLKERGFDRDINYNKFYEEYNKLLDEWREWSVENKVEKNGICSNWEENNA